MATDKLNKGWSFVPIVGRQLDPDYLEHVGKVARHILPRAVELIMREQAGVKYVPQDKLMPKTTLRAGSNDERLLLLQRYAHSTIRSLSDQGKLDQQAALEPIWVPKRQPAIKRQKTKTNYLNLYLMVEDIPFASDGESAFQIETEKDAYTEKFSMRAARSNIEIPSHTINVGRVSDNVVPAYLLQVGNALQQSVPLLEVGGFNVALADPL